MLLLVGCTPQDEGNAPRTLEEFRHGTQGLDIEFLESAPPKKVMAETPFEIIPRVMNKGAYDSDSSYVTLTLEKDYVDVTGQDCVKKPEEEFNKCYTQLPGIIKGRGIVSPNGGNKILDSFNVASKKVGAQTSKFESTALLSVCYEYETKLSGDVCIDPDIYNKGIAEKVCEMNELTYSNQGAPIAIKSIKTNIIPAEDGLVKPEFIIEVENVGKGNALSYKKTKDACTEKSMDREDSWNIVTLNQFSVGSLIAVSPKNDGINANEKKLTCKNFDRKLTQNKATFVCTFANAIKRDDPAFSTQFEIWLKYGYMKSISKTIEIERGAYQ